MYKIILKFPFNNTIEKTSLIQYNKVSGRYLYEGKNTKERVMIISHRPFLCIFVQ